MGDNELKHTITVSDGIENERADKIVAAHFPDLSRAHIQKSFKRDCVLLSGKPISKNHRVSSGDVLEVTLVENEAPKLCPVDIPLKVLFEDEDIVVINKDAGIVTHPGKGTGEDTLVHALLHHTGGKLSTCGGEERPGIVHRLDKETSGVMIFAKTDKAYNKLIKAFSNRETKKQYLALVSGVPDLLSGSIKKGITRHPTNRTKMTISDDGREAHTDWKLEKSFAPKPCALLRCTIHTGRTHQIRVHMKYLGHTILGDKTYGYRFRKEHILEPTRVLLHSCLLELAHPISGELMTFEATLPEDFQVQISSITSP